MSHRRGGSDSGTVASGAFGSGGSDSAAASGDAGSTLSPDATVDAGSCTQVASGRLISAQTFERDIVGDSQVTGPLDAAPVGLKRCGDGLCVLGKLDSRLRVDQDLVAQGMVDAYLLKLSLEGKPVWSERLGGKTVADQFMARSLAADAEGNLVVGGGCKGQVAFPRPEGEEVVVDCRGDRQHVVVAHLDPVGRVDWARDLGTSYVQPVMLRVAVDRLHRTVAVGHLDDAPNSSGGNVERAVVVGWNAGGDELFRRTLTGAVTYPTGAAFDRAGNLVMVGFFTGTVTLVGDASDTGDIALETAGSAVCAIKLTGTGGYLWSRCFGGMSLQALDPQMALAPDDSIVLAGTFWNHELDFGAFGPDAAPSSTRLTSAGSEDIYLAKLDAEGGLVWQEGFGNSQVQTASLGLVTSPDGSILLAGRSSGSLDLGSLHLEAGDSASPFVAAFDVDGNALSAITLGTSAYAEGADGLVVDDCLRFYLAADYSGDLAAPNVVQRGATIGLTLILGKY